MFCNLGKCSNGKLVKILPAGNSNQNSFENDILRLTGISSPRELDEYVVLESHMYKEIFGKTKINAKRSRKRLSVVRICYEGRSIHRAFLSAPAKGFEKEHVALTLSSIYELSQGKQIPMLAKVTLGRGCRWKYYLYHPNAAVRMSFRIGIIGIAVTILLSYNDICRVFKYLIDLCSQLF
jgi:hypothetical protein